MSVSVRFIGNGNESRLLTQPEVQQIIAAAVELGAIPEQARRHFQGQGYCAEDPLTRFLLARVNPAFKDEPDLVLAAFLDLTEIAREKLLRGADPNEPSAVGTTPLMFAALYGNAELAEHLLRAGAAVNVRSSYGLTALGLAAGTGPSDRVVHLLLEAGADFREPGILTSASFRLSPEILRTLIDLGLDINEDGGRPFVNATTAGNITNMKFLLQHGADVNARGGYGRTSLSLVTRDDNANFPADLMIVRFLVEHGADVNARDEDGWTPLMGAARDGDAGVVRFLLDNGAQADATDKNGISPLSLARISGDTEILQLLAERPSRS